MTDRLDQELTCWAQAPEAAEARADAVVAAALTRLPPARFRRGWAGWAGGAVAAGLAAAAYVGFAPGDARRAPAPAMVAQAADPADTFALMFVPTPEEEEFL